MLGLNDERLRVYINQQDVDEDYRLDVVHQFTNDDYPILLSILQRPLSELINYEIPSKEEILRQGEGALFLYVDSQAYQLRRKDGFDWRNTKKQSLKLIIYLANEGIYKLKNAKSDAGKSVLRRQTWRAEDTGIDAGWRREEYILVPDGDPASSHHNVALVHYFMKVQGRGRRIVKRRQRDTSPTGSEEDGGQQVKRRQVVKEDILAPHVDVTSIKPIDGTLESIEALHQNIYENSVDLFDHFPQSLPQLIPIMDQYDELGMDPMQPIINTSTQEYSKASIISFNPAFSHAQDYASVTVVVTDMLGNDPESNYRFSIQMSSYEFHARLINGGALDSVHVLEFTVPSMQGGVHRFSIKAQRTLPPYRTIHSALSYFCVIPADGHVNLAYQLTEVQTPSLIVSRFKANCSYLDLSHNNLDHLRCLEGFHNLLTLIVDHNNLSQDSEIPSLPRCTTLYINHNSITDLPAFLVRLSVAMPKIKYLSLLNNKVCPYGESEAAYNQYRQEVIRKLPNLVYLDSSPVERKEFVGASFGQSTLSRIRNFFEDF